MKLTPYRVECAKLKKVLRVAVLADVHADFDKPILPLLREAAPDLILIPGDLTERREILSGVFTTETPTAARPLSRSRRIISASCHPAGFCP